MKSSKLLINILNDLNKSNLDQIVVKYAKDAEIETIVDTQDLLLQLQKSLETYLFTSILSKSADVEPSDERW